MGVMRALSHHKDAAIARLQQRPDAPMAHVRHRLREWMARHGLTITEMARICCMDHKVLAAHLRGELHNKTYMALHQAFAIEWTTRGEIQAWEWLDDPYQAAKIRHSRMQQVAEFEARLKGLILHGRGGGTSDGMLRRKARTLSRLFSVNWAEVKKRSWIDARQKAEWESADVSHLMLATDDEESTP